MSLDSWSMEVCVHGQLVHGGGVSLDGWSMKGCVLDSWSIKGCVSLERVVIVKWSVMALATK